jgi:ethanolamine-phosphate cytidylyltransferase
VDRVVLVAACRWVSEVVPCAPYRTNAAWVDHFGASVAIHGDDVALDANNQDSFDEMKRVNRSRLVKRFMGPGTLSTTEVINRILYPSTNHHLPPEITTQVSLKMTSSESLQVFDPSVLALVDKVKLFSRGQNVNEASIAVYEFTGDRCPSCPVSKIIKGRVPTTEQRFIYTDGAFDLFTAGHVHFLQSIISIEKQRYPNLEPYLLVGIYDDEAVFGSKGMGFPVLNMLERALMLLQVQVRFVQPMREPCLSVPADSRSSTSMASFSQPR